MIQILLKKPAQQKQKYLDTVGTAATLTLQILQTSLNHIRGNTPAAANKKNFNRYKGVTHALINLRRKKKINVKLFEPKDYGKTVGQYIAIKGALKIPNQIADDVLQLVQHLLDNNSKALNDLLLCPPKELLTKNSEILGYLQGSSEALKIIRLAIDYEKVPVMGRAVRGFFRKENLVCYCPYCNINNAEYIKTKEGKPASIHQLDHFFDKATFPLLGYSFFNLVPADGTCNGPLNKGTKEFTIDYHLNPYTAGFGNHMRFKAKNIGAKVNSIEMDFSDKTGVERFQQMLGIKGIIKEGTNEGNINVFGLRAKYNSIAALDKASTILHKTRIMAKSHGTYVDFQNRMNGAATEKSYLKWYKNHIGTSFKEKDFNDMDYSKMNRDLHDALFKKDNKSFNDDIRDIIKKHSYRL